MRKWISKALIIILLFVMNASPIYAKTKVKVAYPLQSGLSEYNNGIYSGYTYDYLKEMERFTDFEFEFVRLKGDENEQIISAMEKVQNGELDLMGGMLYDESLTSLFDYTSTNYGMGNMAIYVLSDNQKINDTNIYSLKELNVGVVSPSHKENTKLKEFGDMNGVSIIQHLYDTWDNLKVDFDKGKIESVAISEQATVNGNYRVVATYSPRPFYLVTTKGNQELTSQLNEAMASLNKEQPSYMSQLHEKYFSFKNQEFILTEKEKEFIQSHPTIDVALFGGRAPLQTKFDNGEVDGITVDLLNHIGELCQIKFNYHYTESLAEYDELLNQDNILIAAGVITPYREIDNDFSLSVSYLDSSIELVMTKGLSADEIKGKRLAVPEGSEFVDEYDGEVVYYKTSYDCFKAVNEGKADYTYLGSHTAMFYNSSYAFDNITMIPKESLYNMRNCYGVKKSVESPLLNIINKGIDVSSSEIQSIIFQNATYAKEDPSFVNYVKNNPMQATLITMVLVCFYLISRYYVNKKNNEKILKEYNRFQQISDLSGDCFIQYDVKKDILTLSGGAAILLSPYKVIENYLAKDYSGHEQLEAVLKNKRTSDEEVFIEFLDGSKRWQRVFMQPIFGEKNQLIYIIGKITDIQAQKEEQLLWKDLARKDSLTKIYNSAACREMVDGVLSGAKDNELVLMILDIDNFKHINDTLGHFYGDQCLQSLAIDIQKVVKPTDIVARVGGDEFIICLKCPKSTDEVKECCEVLIESISSRHDKPLTISMGVAFSRENQNYDDLYQIADAALYEVKNAGRNDYRFANTFEDVN